MSRVKNLVTVTDEEGKKVVSVLRTAIGILTTFLIGAIFTWATWVTTQSYTVAINKKLIEDTGARHDRDIGINAQDIIMNAGETEDTLETLQNKIDTRFDRINGILHGRITKVDDKYDAKMTEMEKMLMQTNTLIVEMLIQKNKDIQLQKKEVKIQQEILDKK